MVRLRLCFVREVVVVELIELRTVQAGAGTVEIELIQGIVEGGHRNPKIHC